MKQTAPSSLYQRIYDLVRQIPSGRVTTYGQISQLADCNARTVGFAMAALPIGSDVPWQRVINRLGKVSSRTDGEGNILQRHLLENEGLEFDHLERVDLQKSGWFFPPANIPASMKP